MIGPRRLMATLTIDDFGILMSDNIESVVFGILKAKYSKVCYLKCFVISVNEIIHMSDIEFNQNDISNCSCNINVIFDCTVEILYHEEIITDMKVLSSKPNVTTFGSENKIAIVKEAVVGDIMCIRSIYEPGSNKIKIGCARAEHIQPNISGLVHMTDEDFNITKHVNKFSSKFFKISKFEIEEVDENHESVLITADEFIHFMILKNNDKILNK